MILLSREQHGSCSTLFVFLATLVFSSYSSALEVDTQSREASRQFYLDYFQTNSLDIEWSGDHRSCDAGMTAVDFRDATETQINYFRAMAGVPAEVKLDEEFNDKAQEAALLMSKNIRINHFPPEGWSCYTENAAEAARSSNLLLGTTGPNAITRYMFDPGAENYFVGHRRWILHPQTERMGTGDVPRSGFAPAANTLWVFDGNTWNPRPETREPFVAWPPAGYVPSQVVYPRWSFGMPGADFSAANVTVTLDGRELPLRTEPVLDGYSDPTIVWQLQDRIGGFRPVEEDVEVTVTIRNVLVDEVRRSFEYDVTLFDPDVLSAADPPDFIPEPVPIIEPEAMVTPTPTCPGSDFNEDGVLSFDDFLLLAQSYGSSRPRSGDTNCDGEVDFDDFLEFVDDYQEANSSEVSQSVPEPDLGPFGCLAILMLLGVIRRRKPVRGFARI